MCVDCEGSLAFQSTLWNCQWFNRAHHMNSIHTGSLNSPSYPSKILRQLRIASMRTIRPAHWILHGFIVTCFCFDCLQGLKVGAVYGIALVHTRVIPPLYSMLLAAINLVVIILRRQVALLPVTRTFNLPLKPRASRGELSAVRLTCLRDVSE